MSGEQEQALLIEQATRWLVLLRSGHASHEDLRAFAQWRARDARHQQLCDQLERTLGVFRVAQEQGVRGEQLQRTLSAAGASRRRVMRGALVGAGVMLGAGLLANRQLPLDELTADLHTATGQRQRINLDDGSELVLNARSAVDLDFSAQRRVLRLRRGEIQLRVAADRRPLLVVSPFGQLASQGGRLQLRLETDRCAVTALDASLELVTLAGERLQLPRRQQVSFDRFAFAMPAPLQGGEGAWVDGLLEVRNQRLGEVLDALRPYRSGVLRVDPAVAELRVSGLFRLDDSDQALDVLARTLPIRIARRTALWVSVGPA
ncbi:FecR domain-containing protein [Pseudomonas sp. PDNC002]|uniref:FecR domain-containing protein n=1 Tax=Pseudomonas sp. PDNC002 TaxID=2811422 RepID=UPI00196466C6|nr:FecR domain-containing protein [Pseudomonas sp. PDNC002]QRY77231.1 FecR domain-containing protein [Pseudomonas sp. PDNC002]